MQYQLKNGKFYRSTELSQEEVLELLNKSSIASPKKLELEDYNLGKPTSPNVKICKEGETVEDGTPAAWDNGYGEWLYNWHGAMEECKYIGKRMPTNEEWTELTPNGKEDIPNVVYAGYCSAGSCHSRGDNAYYWSASVYAPSPTNSWSQVLDSSSASVYRGNYVKTNAFSVRCLKD